MTARAERRIESLPASIDTAPEESRVESLPASIDTAREESRVESLPASIDTAPEESRVGSLPASFDMAMAYCRLVSEQGVADRSSKPSKEAWCLSQILSAGETLLAAEEVNLIDLGCGNGEKALQILHFLNARGVGPVGYAPVDQSPYCGLFAILTVLCADRRISRVEAGVLLGAAPTQRILDLFFAAPLPYETLIAELWRAGPAVDAIERENVIVPTRGVIVDFVRNAAELRDTLASLPLHRDCKNVYLLLGQTLGNYEPSARRQLLCGLRDQMNENDVLLIDGGLRPRHTTQRADDIATQTENLVAFYRLGERFMRQDADCRESRYRVSYSPASHRVVYWFERPDGTRQELGFSNMWMEKGFAEELHSTGYEVLGTASSLDLPGLRSGPETIAALARRGENP
jgi:uncharacterized SAM-dependent methyltransferase